MRNPITRCLSIALLAAPLFFAACGGDDSSTKNDLAIAQADQSVVVTGDQSVVVTGDAVCSTVLFCALKCSGPDSAGCVKGCVESGTTNAQTLFQALLTCGYTHCIGQTPDGGNEDGGITSCTDSSDVTAGCQACVSKEAQSADCKIELGACFNG